MDLIKRLGKKEILGLFVGFAILVVGIAMQVSRIAIPKTEGLLSTAIWAVGDWALAENATMISFVVVGITVLPAVFFQVLSLVKLMLKLHMPYCQMVFHLLIYGVSLGFYRNAVISAGELVLFLLISLVCYFILRLLVNGCSKKKLLLLFGLVLVAGIVAVLEFPVVHWQIYAQCVLIAVESVIMAWYRGKSVLLRRTLRNGGSLVLLALFGLLNYYLF